MSYETLLEIELSNRAKRNDDAADLWQRYNIVKNYLAQNYYEWIHDRLPYYTNHGEPHIKAVIQAASLLLGKLLKDRKRCKELTSLDIFVLLSGILWHDVGMVLGRTDHEKRIGEISEEVKRLAFSNPSVQRLVVEIASAHGGKNGLRTADTETYCMVNSKHYKVYPRALAAILRFADEISEDQSRISIDFLPRVPNENRIFWEYANAISSSIPEPENERIVVNVDVDVDKAALELPHSNFPAHCNEDGTTPLITYILCRLEKMNNERVYCSREFRSYVIIRQIDARFHLNRGPERLRDHDLAVVFGDGGLQVDYPPKVQIVEEFFAEHPTWKPEKLRGL